MNTLPSYVHIWYKKSTRLIDMYQIGTSKRYTRLDNEGKKQPYLRGINNTKI